MFETREVIYELYDVYSKRTIRYSENIYELERHLKSFNLADDVEWEIKMRNSMPDSCYPTKADMVKINRDKLINDLLDE